MPRPYGSTGSFTFAASYLATFGKASFAANFFETLLEPAGWFTAWTGMDQLFYTAHEHKSELDFYMSRIEFSKTSYFSGEIQKTQFLSMLKNQPLSRQPL